MQLSDPAAPYLDGLAQEGRAPLGVGEECRHGGQLCPSPPLCPLPLGEDSVATGLCKESRGGAKEGGWGEGQVRVSPPQTAGTSLPPYLPLAGR